MQHKSPSYGKNSDKCQGTVSVDTDDRVVKYKNESLPDDCHGYHDKIFLEIRHHACAVIK